MEDVWSEKLPMCRHAVLCCVEWCHFVPHQTCHFVFPQEWRCTLDLPISKYCYNVVDQEFHTSGTAVVLLYGLSIWNIFWRQQVGLGERSLLDSWQAGNSYACVCRPVKFVACGKGTLYAVWKQPLWICMSCPDGVHKWLYGTDSLVSAINCILSENVILWGALCSDHVQAHGMMEATVCCQPQEVCGSGVANVWNMSECCTVAGWLMGGTVAGHWADLHTVVWHLWMAGFKRSDMWPCCRLLQEQTCLLWCDANQCHHGGFISGRHWHIELGLTYLQWMLHREMSITSLWWGAVIGFINFQISCCMKSNLDCRSRKTWMCRSN